MTSDATEFDQGEAVPVEGCQAAMPMTPVSIKKAQGHVAAMLGRVRAADAASRRKKANHEITRYLTSFDARYIATLKAYRMLRKHQRPDAKLLPGIAEALSPWDGSDEEVLLCLKPKEDNPSAFRAVLEFGVEHRALQYLVRPVLEARAVLHPDQYGLRGMHAAIRRVIKLYESGLDWAVETDITNCFPSFDGEKVPDQLPVPKRVTQRIILGSSLNIRVHPSLSVDPADPELDEYAYALELADARRGFPQGSATSSFAVELLLAPICRELPQLGSLTGYVDNFLVMASTESDVVSMTQALWLALKACPAGQLGSKYKIFEPGKPVDFLGHRIRRCGTAVRVEPSPKRLMGFEVRLNRDVAKLAKLHSYPDRAKRYAQKLRRLVRSWTSTYQLCTDIEFLRKKALARIEHALTG